MDLARTADKLRVRDAVAQGTTISPKIVAPLDERERKRKMSAELCAGHVGGCGPDGAQKPQQQTIHSDVDPGYVVFCKPLLFDNRRHSIDLRGNHSAA